MFATPIEAAVETCRRGNAPKVKLDNPFKTCARFTVWAGGSVISLEDTHQKEYNIRSKARMQLCTELHTFAVLE